jgi:hypothetical protein
MIEHVTHLLAAYHDGELQGKRLNHVEEHLSTCESCKSELEHLQTLSNLLVLHPAPSGLTSNDRFVAQVALRMPRYPEEPTVKRVFNFGWRAAPVGILGIWAFVQSLLIVSGILFLLMRFGFNLEPLTGLLSPPSEGLSLGMFFSFEGESIGELGRTALEILGNGGPLGWGPMLYIALMLILGLLYCSWMASWWVRQQGHRVQGNYK